jgi:hypothetical protein
LIRELLAHYDKLDDEIKAELPPHMHLDSDGAKGYGITINI